MPDLTPQQWGAIGLAVAAAGTFAYSHLGDVRAWFGKFVASEPDERIDALKNLDALYDYFKAAKCQQGMEGVRKLVPHVFDEEHAEGQA